MTMGDPEDDLANYNKKSRKPGDLNPDDVPKDFSTEQLVAANPTKQGLRPEQMID